MYNNHFIKLTYMYKIYIFRNSDNYLKHEQNLDGPSNVPIATLDQGLEDDFQFIPGELFF